MDKTSKNLFNNTKLAFTNKSNLQLKKAFFLFSVLDYPVLTKLGNSFLLLVLKLNLPFKGIIKNTIFNHFCGGETIEECDDTFKSLNELTKLDVRGEFLLQQYEGNGWLHYRHASEPLWKLLTDMNKYSLNLTAESVLLQVAVKETERPSRTEDGII